MEKVPLDVMGEDTASNINYLTSKKMKKQIWKFNLAVQSILKIEMPKGAEIISIQSQKCSIAQNVLQICDGRD